jgi:predicted Rossmann fold flavoprotein
MSGPIILTASCYCDFLKYPGGFRLFLNLKPALSREQLEERLRREFLQAPDRHLPGAVRPLFPARLAEVITELSGLETHRRAASFTEPEIKKLAALIQEVPVTVTGTRGYREAIITRGGISVKEINPSTMESRRIAGLYAAGEVLDVDAQTGGFNLQIAWSTGRLAGQSI